MKDLIAKLEAATEGSTELDKAICAALGIELVYWGRVDAYFSPIPYTTSLDPALTLVPEGWKWDIRTEAHASFPGFGGHAEIMDKDWPDPLAGDGKCFEGHAATPALALCIAALKARKD